MNSPENTSFHYLLHQYVAGKATSEELRQLETLLQQKGQDVGLLAAMQQMARDSTGESTLDPERAEQIIQAIIQDEPPIMVIKRRRPAAWLMAASVVLLTGAGIYYWVKENGNKAADPATAYKMRTIRALPDNDKATLRLADGRVIGLDSLQNGRTIQQGNARIVKSSNGQLVYEITPSALEAPAAVPADTAVAFNTISTPRGGQYKITLADGTAVWLNAGSSLRFPAVFKGNERRVEMQGEGYFEVAPSKQLPFVVRAGGIAIQVLGTSFNLNAYNENDVMKATLLSGSIVVNRQDENVRLQPGQQALIPVLIPGNASIQVTAANAEEVLAWKNGIFQFNDQNIYEIMGELARWYNLEVRYEASLGNKHFGGTISRKESMEEVLKMLELTKAVRFKIEGKKVTVTQ